MWACTAARLLPLLAAAAALALLPTAAAQINSAGQPLLTATAAVSGDHSFFFELPVQPAGLVVMLHRCGRNAEDFWPPSSVCPQCIGMPEAVSISRQALARGYALLAINSANRTLGSAGRCFSWASDAFPVRDIIQAFQKQHGLGAAPLYLTGCSSGGSLALRIPSIMAVDGVMAVAIGLELAAFPPANPWPENYTYPPAAYVHFSRDDTISRQVDTLLTASADAGLAAGSVEVPPAPIAPAFFSQRDAMISPELSTELHGALQNQLRVLDGDGYLTEDWLERVTPQELQAALLPLIQGSLRGDSGGAVAAASLDGNNSGPAVTEQASALVLYQHVQEELAVAWGEHTNLGDYATAWLSWLEGGASGNFENLAKALKIVEPAALAGAVDGAPAAVSPALPPAPSGAPRAAAGGVAAAAAAAAVWLLLA